MGSSKPPGSGGCIAVFMLLARRLDLLEPEDSSDQRSVGKRSTGFGDPSDYVGAVI